MPLTVLPGKFPILPPHMHIDPEDPNVACRLCRRRRFSTGSQTRPTRISFHSPGDIELTWPLQRAGEGSVNSAARVPATVEDPVNSPSTLRQLSVTGSGRVEDVDHGFIRRVGDLARSVTVQGLSRCRQLCGNSWSTLGQGLNATFTAVDCGERCDVAFQPEDRLVDVQEIAAYLEVPVKTLYAWRYRREGPPAFRVGRHLRYRWSDVELWIQQRIEPASTGSVSVSRRRVGRGG